MSNNLGEDSKRFFKFWRERYEWPAGVGRKASEEKIFELLKETRNVISSEEGNQIKRLLIDIHRWKTNNQRGISERYDRVLTDNVEVVPFLQGNLPLKSPTLSPEFFEEMLDTLKIRNCNLPICSAQASFLLNRKLPVLDRFVAQFFSLTMSENILNYSRFDMKNVLRDIHPIGFRIEDDGTRRCIPRLSVYQLWGYKANKSQFIGQLIPELIRLVKSLNREKVKYEDIHDLARDFSCVDVEMAVFAFSTQNRQYFQCFYEKSPTRLVL